MADLVTGATLATGNEEDADQGQAGDALAKLATGRVAGSISTGRPGRLISGPGTCIRPSSRGADRAGKNTAALSIRLRSGQPGGLQPIGCRRRIHCATCPAWAS